MNDLLQAAYQYRTMAIERVAHLVAVESPSGDPTGIAAMNSLLASGFEAVGASVLRDPGPDGDHLVCSWPGESSEDDGHTLLIGHSDTVFPVGTTATRPFTLASDQDTVTGPGVYDMKGALVEVEIAMALLRSQDRAPQRPVRAVIINDEEVGSIDGQRVVAKHAQNATAVIGLEPPLPGGGLKIGRRGVARMEVEIQGVEAHSGLDSANGVSAVDELIDQLLVLRSRMPTSTTSSLNVGVVKGGTGANVIAGRATAVVGLRFETPRDEASLRELFASLTPVRPGVKLAIRQLSYRPPWVADPANPIASELIAISSGFGLIVETGTSGGAGDTNLTGSAGIPTVDGLGPDGAGAHAASEHASITSLLQRAALLAMYLHRSDRTSP